MLHLIAGHFGYPIVEQLRDLGYITAKDLDLIDSPLLAPNWVLIERLERAISESRRGSSHVADLIYALQASTLETRDFARWRAKVFDIPVGTEKYGHVGFHAVEFEAWLGPTPDPDQDARLEYRLHLANRVLERLIPSEEIRRHRVFKKKDPQQVGIEELTGRVERAELEERFGHLRAVGHFNTYGDEGSLAGPLLGLKKPGPRHVYVEPVSTQVGRETAKWHSPDKKLFGDHLNRVVVVAPPAASAVPLAHLVGRALGWTVSSLRQDAGTSAGEVVRIGEQSKSELALNRASRAFRTASARARPNILVATYTKYLSTTEEGRHLLQDPNSVVVIVRPTFETLQAWAVRQRLGQGSRTTDSPEIGRKYLDDVEEIARQRPAGTFRKLEFVDDFDWWPANTQDRLHFPGRHPDTVEFFEHPRIGDIRLKAAYQLSMLLIRGKLPLSDLPPETYFMEGPVARFQDKLRRDRSRPLR